MFSMLLLFNALLTVILIHGQGTIQFHEETLNRLRLKPATVSRSTSYVNFELLTEYQCAIECVKDKTMCTGYAYDAATKTCSMFDDTSRVVDDDVVKLVSETRTIRTTSVSSYL